MEVTQTSTTTTSKATQAQDQLDSDYKTFLTLLTAQLQNQDPTAPMDSSQFVTQIAQMTQVEQAVQTNSNLETIANMMGMNAAMSDAALIGRTVETTSNTVTVQDGEAKFTYLISDETEMASASIYDAAGNLVKMFNLDAEPGVETDLPWDGTDINGDPVADGNYTVEFSAKDEQDNAVLVHGYTRSDVEEVVFENGVSELRLANGDQIMSNMVIAIR